MPGLLTEGDPSRPYLLDQLVSWSELEGTTSYAQCAYLHLLFSQLPRIGRSPHPGGRGRWLQGRQRSARGPPSPLAGAQAGTASLGSHCKALGGQPGGRGHVRMASDDRKVSLCRDDGEVASPLHLCPESMSKHLGKPI